MHENAIERKQNAKVAKHEARKRVAYGGGNVADWGSVDAGIIQRAIATVAKAGGALRFGYTRDGGAYALGVLGDGDPYTEYLRPGDDVEQYLTVLTEQWE